MDKNKEQQLREQFLKEFQKAPMPSILPPPPKQIDPNDCTLEYTSREASAVAETVKRANIDSVSCNLLMTLARLDWFAADILSKLTGGGEPLDHSVQPEEFLLAARIYRAREVSRSIGQSLLKIAEELGVDTDGVELI